MSVSRSALLALVVLACAATADAAGRCDAAGAVAAAQDAVLAGCPCAEATSRAAYLDCARGVIASRVEDGSLPASCRGRVRRFASRSTCGRPGFVACCIRSANGPWRARIRRATRGCSAPPEGAACRASLPHLENACDAERGCAGCGDGVVELANGEECEPPGAGACDAACRFVHTCGNGVVELGEECDGQTGCGPGCTLERSMCCDFGDQCFEHRGYDDFDAYFNGSKVCFQVFFGQSSFGTCEGPPCLEHLPAGYECHVGSCGDRAIDPLPLCCQQAEGGCRDTVATTAGAIGAFGCSTFPPPEQGDVDRLMIGTCGGDGRCVPG